MHHSFIILTLIHLPSLVADKPTSAQIQKENTHIQTHTGQDREEQTKEKVSNMAECSWSIQASLEVSNSQVNR